MPAYLSRIEPRAIDLPAGAAVPIDLDLNGARSWTFLVKNTGDTNPVTTATLQYGPLDTNDVVLTKLEAVLAPGTDGDVLKMVAGAPAWAAP